MSSASGPPSVTTIKTVCEICGSRDFGPVRVPAVVAVSRCRGCGHIAATSFAHASDGDLYEEKFIAKTKHPTYSFDGRDYVPRAMEKWKPLLQELCAFKTHGRMLDIGCSTGVLLNEARKLHGWEPYGLEVSPFAVQTAR